MDKQLFDDAIGEAPRSTVDVDAVIRRGRRAALVRRAANPAVAAGVAVLLLVGAVAFTMTRGENDGTVPVGSPPTSDAPASTTKTSPSPTVPGAPTPTTPAVCDDDPIKVEDTQLAIDRLDATVRALVTVHAQPLQLTASTGALIDGVQYGPLEFFQVTGDSTTGLTPLCDGDYLLSRAVTTAGDGEGNIMVVFEPAQYVRPGAGTGCDNSPVTTGETECEETTHGDVLAMSSTRLSQEGVTTFRVDVVKPDGTNLIVEVENSRTTSKSTDGPSAEKPPLTKQELLELALEPELSLFPNA